MSDLASIILLVIGSAIFVGAGYYGGSRSRLGPRLAREKISESVLFALSFEVVFSLNHFAKGDQWSVVKAIIWLGCAALLWITVAVLALRKPKTGKILLNLGRPNKRQVWVLPFFVILGGIVLCLDLGLSTSSAQRLEALSLVVLIWSFGIVLALMGRKETLLTEEGVRTGYTGFRWEQIKHYMWSGMNKNHHYLFFKIKRRLPLANTFILDVPDEVRQVVSDIVIQHTSRNVGQPVTVDKP